jgi:hypothetical protein
VGEIAASVEERVVTEPGDRDAEAWIDAMAPVVGLVITEEARPGVRTFLAVAATMADRLEAVEIADDELWLAPVFTPEAKP